MTAIPRGMRSNPPALYRLIGSQIGCTRIEAYQQYYSFYNTPEDFHMEVHDIVSTIGDNGIRCPLASTKYEYYLMLHRKGCDLESQPFCCFIMI
jgi:hypothetical protein